MRYILYHENNLKYPWLPQEDWAEHNENGVFVVADGITHDLLEDDIYPTHPDAANVSKIVCKAVTNYTKTKKPSLENIRKAYDYANEKVLEYNKTTQTYKNREENSFTIGACTTACVWVQDKKLYCGVIADCFVSTFSSDLTDKPTFIDHVSKSVKYYKDTKSKLDTNEGRKFWRKNLRNNKIVKNGISYGYGSIDGRKGYKQYLQLYEADLKSGDLVCVYTDGFIHHIEDIDLIRYIKSKKFSNKTFEEINKRSKTDKFTKEKTGYFIVV